MIHQLNPEQQQAATYVSGPLLVIAGAGSGKTRVITEKIAYLLDKCGYLPQYITALTFTNKSAEEMLERVQALGARQLNIRGLTITTFHSLGLKILKEECQSLGYKKNFSVLDSYDSAKIITDIVNACDKATLRAIQGQISLWKNALLTPEYLATCNDVDQFLVDVFRSYQDTLKTYQAVDFDDLIKLPDELFSTNLEVLYKWQQKIRYLLVDEYQDTNECQYKLIKLLCGRSENFTVVGDDDQSIYAWRGAKPENLNQLQQDFKALKIITLEQNYRSTGAILNVANNVIRNNPKLCEKKLWSDLAAGEAVRIIAAKNDEAEAEMVARKIMLHQQRMQTGLSDYAILYRSNHQSRILEQVLRNYQLLYTISGGQSFFDRAEVKDITAYLRLLVNDDDDISFIRAITTPKRGIGQVTLEKLANYAKARHLSLFAALFEEGFAAVCNQTQLEDLLNFGNMINDFQFRMARADVGELLTELVYKINYEAYLYEYENDKTAEKKWSNVLSLVSYLSKKATDTGKTLPELVQMIFLITMLGGGEDSDVQAIKLSTIHAAKGLEYPYVFLISCEEGIIPHQESINNDMIEEERRLMYVGITRAQKELTMSYCEQRKRAGELSTVERSRFIDELGSEDVIDESHTKHQKISDSRELGDRLSELQALLM